MYISYIYIYIERERERKREREKERECFRITNIILLTNNLTNSHENDFKF